VLTVRGDGFTFGAPSGWTVVRAGSSTAASDGPVNRIEVSTFTLEKPYRTALFAAVTRELDHVAAGLAVQLSGKVAARSTIEIDGRRARLYRIDYGPGKTEEIAFVLEGKTEYELLCRRPSSGTDSACSGLRATFAVV
jgi:hypothetical protein